MAEASVPSSKFKRNLRKLHSPIGFELNMKIKFGTLQICADGETPINLKNSIKRNVQIENIIDSKSSYIADRSNRRETLSFEIERAYKNECEAQGAIFETLRLADENSPAKLDFYLKDSNASKTKTIASATLSNCSARVDGRIARFSFEFYTS